MLPPSGSASAIIIKLRFWFRVRVGSEGDKAVTWSTKRALKLLQARSHTTVSAATLAFEFYTPSVWSQPITGAILSKEHNIQRKWRNMAKILCHSPRKIRQLTVRCNEK
jgi:hypothetical protein